MLHLGEMLRAALRVRAQFVLQLEKDKTWRVGIVRSSRFVGAWVEGFGPHFADPLDAADLLMQVTRREQAASSRSPSSS